VRFDGGDGGEVVRWCTGTGDFGPAEGAENGLDVIRRDGVPLSGRAGSDVGESGFDVLVQ
jgi:hypothetical protein